MSREDEMIREALRLDIQASDELNKKILRSVERKKRNYGFLRAVASVAACLIALLGTVAIVDAANGGKLYKAVKKRLEKNTYIYENGSKAIVEVVRRGDEDWEKVTFVEENVILYRPISSEKIGYWLCLKVIDRRGRNCFVSLETSEDATEENLYYEIRGGFRDLLTDYDEANEKRQVLEGLHEAASHAESETVKTALTDLASDLERDRRIFFASFPGTFWGKEGDILFFEDMTDHPAGDAAIIVNPVNERQMSWIFTVQIDESRNVKCLSSWVVFSENAYRELLDNGIPVYDLRDKK